MKSKILCETCEGAGKIRLVKLDRSIVTQTCYECKGSGIWNGQDQPAQQPIILSEEEKYIPKEGDLVICRVGGNWPTVYRIAEIYNYEDGQVSLGLENPYGVAAVDLEDVQYIQDNK